MSEPKSEYKQSADEDKRKRYLENHSAYDLVDMISYINDEKIKTEFRNLVLDFVISNSIDLKIL